MRLEEKERERARKSKHLVGDSSSSLQQQESPMCRLEVMHFLYMAKNLTASLSRANARRQKGPRRSRRGAGTFLRVLCSTIQRGDVGFLIHVTDIPPTCLWRLVCPRTRGRWATCGRWCRRDRVSLSPRPASHAGAPLSPAPAFEAVAILG